MIHLNESFLHSIPNRSIAKAGLLHKGMRKGRAVLPCTAEGEVESPPADAEKTMRRHPFRFGYD